MAEIAPIPGLDKKATTPAITKFVEVRHDPQTAIKRTLRGFISSRSGRDSVLRTIQYTLRLVLLYRLRSSPQKPSFAPSRSIKTSFALVSFISALRRILSLSHIVESFKLLNPSSYNSLKQGRLPNKANTSSIDQILSISRQTLDLFAVLTDNLYLGTRLGVIPGRSVDEKRAKRIDQSSDLATLFSVLIGFYQVSLQRKKLKQKGNMKRIRAVQLEKQLEDLEFWDSASGNGRGEVKNSDQVEEERVLRERVRVERGKLRRFREEMGGLRWEKWRLTAEGIFAMYDALDLQIGKEVAQSWTGVTASLIEAGQTWSEYLAAGSK